MDLHGRCSELSDNFIYYKEQHIQERSQDLLFRAFYPIIMPLKSASSDMDGRLGLTSATDQSQCLAAQLQTYAPLVPSDFGVPSKMPCVPQRRKSTPALSRFAGRKKHIASFAASLHLPHGLLQQSVRDMGRQHVINESPLQLSVNPRFTQDDCIRYRLRGHIGNWTDNHYDDNIHVDDKLYSMLPKTIPKPMVNEVFRSIPRPRFPIPVTKGPRDPFSIEAQRKVMKWSHKRRHFWPDPEWLHPPNIENIKDLAWPYLESLGAEYHSISVGFLAEGGFNRVFTIHTTNSKTQERTDYVFRVALPVDPYYKTESDVATTEIVRHFTTIPVPIIYAYDSSINNPIGLEWILMEKIEGEKLAESWTSMDYDSKLRLTQITANWTTELAKISSSKIGSIYMRYTTEDLEFYVGRSVAYLVSQEDRLKYEAYRGPFDSLEHYYDSILALNSQDIKEVTQGFQSGLFQFESTSPDFRGTFLDQHRVYYLDGHGDWSDEEWRAEQTKELNMLSDANRALRKALPAICAKAPETSHELRTFLAHDDMSRRNIFVDDAGIPVALLDWETIQLRPLLFLTNPPDFIQSKEEEYEPELDIAAREKQWEKFGYSEEDKEEFRRTSRDWFEEHMEDYICTKLRSEFIKELQRLECPLARAVWEDYSYLDRELLEHVLDFSRNAEDHLTWIEDVLEVGEDNETEGSDKAEEERGK